MKKRFLSILLTLCMLLSIVPLTSVVATAETVTPIVENTTENKSATDVTFTVLDGTEDAKYAFDGDTDTKWCVQSFASKDTYVIVEATQAVALTGYTFTTGSDTGSHSGSNPKSWTIYGANDYYKLSGVDMATWKIVAQVSDGEMPISNKASKSFTVSGCGGYKYYKLHIDSVVGTNETELFQLGEISFAYDSSDSVTPDFTGWKALTSDMTELCFDPLATKYYLSEDVTLSSYLTINGFKGFPLILDLNGHVLKWDSHLGGPSIHIEGDLILNDSRPTRTHDDTSLPTGGIINGNFQNEGIYLAAGHLEMNGGTIYRFFGGSISGGVIMDSSTFTMNGGAIRECKSENGGGVYDRGGGSFTMNGGTIANCSAIERGGGVYLIASNYFANGGIITGCTAGKMADGVYAGGETVVKNTSTTGGVTICYSELYFEYSQDGKLVKFANGDSVYAWEFLPDSGGKAIKPANPTKNGYTFEGWYAEQTGGTRFDFSTVITADTILYARWTAIPANAPTVSCSNVEVTYGQYTNKKIGVTLTDKDEDTYSYSYQWYDSSENKITGATESTYTVPNNLTAGSHDYYCVVTAKRSDNGETATTKKKITVAVNKGIASFTEPTAQNDITYGATLDTVGLTDGWTWDDGTTKPTVINSGYTAYFTPTDTANYDWESVTGWNATLKRVERIVAVTVNKANQSAPAEITSIAESIDGKADGKIKGVTTEMEYSKGGNASYIPITSTEITGLEDGTYYVRYKADDNYNASEYTRITVNLGEKLTVTVPTTQAGYTLTVNKTKLVWNDSVEIAFALANGYSKLNNFAVKVNGDSISLDANGKFTVTNAQSDITVTVVGVADITAPTGEIKLGTNSWKTFLNNITFGLFFKDTKEVTITATDNDGESVKIEYLLSDKELTAEELATVTFTAYNDKFTVEPNNEYVIYAKLSDKTGNVTYINSNGIVLDNVAPIITSIINGETYCEAQTVTVSDKYEVTVTVNGTPITLDANGQFTLSPASGTQTVVAKDKADNVSAEMIVTVNDGHEGGTATCTKKAVCKHCGLEYGEVDNSNHDLEHNKENAATVTTTGNKEYWYCKDCKNNFSDKDGKNVIDLKDTVISKLAPEIIDGKGQSLTAGEKKELTFRSNAAYSDFIRVEVDGKTVDGKNYTVKEGSTIVTLKADYVATLSVGEHTLGIVSESGTATTTFTVNAKVVDTNSPQTGDNSHMTLWFALLFVSGSLLTVTGVYGKKKKYLVK